MDDDKNPVSKAQASALDKCTTIVAKAFVKVFYRKNNDRNKIFYDFRSILEDRGSIEKIKGNNELNDIVHEIYYLIKNNYIDG